MASLETAGNGSWDKDRHTRGAQVAVRRIVLVLKLLGTAGVAASCIFLFGFVAFLHSLERADQAPPHRADAIVALTGGAERISDAVEWLKNGSGKRLLISGVAHDVTRERLAHKAPAVRDWLQCCIDLGHAAQNTVGNAKETRHWVTSHGYRSLLIVTSSYHMPRALVELRRQLPGIDLHAAPVVTEKLKAMDFWQHPGLLKTISIEYAKFVVAYVRASLTSAHPMGESTENSTRRRA
jgi:uncharacterized SAM-binding protein YcdF (DUF218 family)